jgi:hypothetical protein
LSINRKTYKVRLSTEGKAALVRYCTEHRLSFNAAINQVLMNMGDDVFVFRRKHKSKEDGWAYQWTPETADLYEWAGVYVKERRLSSLIEGLLRKEYDPHFLALVDLTKRTKK